MLLWLKRLLAFLVLCMFRLRPHDGFLKQVTSKCKKRRNRRHVPGITEELDEVTELPDNCRDDLFFSGFSSDGEVVSFRIIRTQNRQEISHVFLEIPGLGRFKHNGVRALDVGAGKLKFEMLEPMSRWKVKFHGTMKLLVSDMYSELGHASVSLYWQCTADPFDYWTCVSSWQLANNMAKLPWNRIWSRISERMIRYEQWGELRGTIKIDGQEDRSVRLKGVRVRRIEDAREISPRTVLSHHAVVEGGKLFLSNGCIVDNEDGKETFGYVTYPVGERCPTDQSNLDVVPREAYSPMTIRYPFATGANGVIYMVDKMSAKLVAYETNCLGMKTAKNFTTFQINGEIACGISTAESECPEDMQIPITQEIARLPTQAASDVKMTTDLRSEVCRHTRWTGGKGSNLALMKGMGYPVPDGFCLTTVAFEAHLESSTALRRAVKNIERVIKDKIFGNLRQACSEAVEELADSCISDSLTHLIVDTLINTFGQEYERKSFAVRSSGVGEDGVELSVAGQMETLLAVKGTDQIIDAVKHCWASSLAFRVVEYRRQNGQEVIQPMAVVIQEMVDADVAGVLFTNDPVTGNSVTMMITAAPGLGEMVVSGKTDPDTIWIARGNYMEELDITRRTLGCKPTRFNISSSGSGIDELQNTNLATEICLSDEEVHKICNIGCNLEEAFGHPQDVEWALVQGSLFVLQSRPITSLLDESDEEIIQEFDTPITMDSSCLTTCNLGEILPGAATPLTLDYFVNGLNGVFAKTCRDNSGSMFPQYATQVLGSSSNRCYANITSFSVSVLSYSLVTKNDIEISFLGHAVEEHKIDTIRSCKGRDNTMFQTAKAMLLDKVIRPRQLTKQFDEWSEALESFHIGKTASSAIELYHAIDEKRHIYGDVMHGYYFKMQSLPLSIIMGMLRGGNTSITTENSSDIAILFANCKDLISADVPSAVAELAHAISVSTMKEKFINLPDDECHSLLVDAEEPIRSKYANFMKIHGHRCIKEFEFLEKSWAMESSKLISTLKPLVKQSTLPKTKEEMTNAEVVGMLQTPLTRFQKFLIRSVLLDRAKACVAARESGKSVFIKTIDEFKKAFWRLADLMVREGQLPEDDLLFFLTHREIGTLLETRSPVLVKKAKLRKRIFPKQDALRYPKVCFGRMVPLPEKMQIERRDKASLSLKGMPVGKGVVTGRACVLKSLADADNIQKGDILICPVTDIGWSPYFSMISGIATEMGGLISHGAVVAREVGIPCVVNIDNATDLLQTGDIVKIDGLKGVLERLTE